jgi:uncharacterized repeat protein (TIGR03803 family)
MSKVRKFLLLATLFALVPAHARATSRLTTIVVFHGTNGAQPSSDLLQAEDGNLYGTTMEGGADNIGTLFKLTPGGALTTIASFSGPNGKWPSGKLVQGKDGSLF